MSRFSALQERISLLGSMASNTGILERFRPDSLASIKPIGEFLDVRRASRPENFKAATEVNESLEE